MNNSNEISLKNSNNQVFIGARKLSDSEVKRILPNFDTIEPTIENFRNIAIENSKNEHVQKTEYTNTISILGARGTGKTSVMYTIKNTLKDDIVLEMIKPDNITSSGTITANVLGQLKRAMKDVLKEVKKYGDEKKDGYKKYPDFFKNCVYIENNVLTDKFYEMYEYYCYSEDEYKKTLISNYTNFDTYAKNSSKILNADKYFQDKLSEFIDELIATKKKLNESKKQPNESKKQPLIIVLIDDIDLRTSKVEEVINALQSYSISDKVVTIISADDGTFADSLHISLMNKDNLPNGFQIYKTTNKNEIYFDKKKELADEFIKKFLPSAFRYEINKWDLNGRANYSFIIKNDKEETNLILMEELLELYRKCGCNESFFYYIEDGKNCPLIDFYNIFDDTARGLVNVFYRLNNALSLDFSKDNEKFVEIKSLVDTIINSNTKLADYKDEIYRDFILWGNLEENTELKYENLTFLKYNKDIFNESIEKSQKKDYERYNDIFNIMYFTNCCLKNARVDTRKREKLNNAVIINMIKLNNVVEVFGEDAPAISNVPKDYQTSYQNFYKPLFEYKYNFSLYLYYSFIEFQGEEFYCENMKDFKSEIKYFYSFYKGVMRYCSVMDNNSQNVQKFLNQLFYDADEELLKILNTIINIGLTDKLLSDGYLWLYGIFEKIEISDLKDRRLFEMFFIKMLNMVEFSDVIENIDNETQIYIQNGKNILQNKPTDISEIDKSIYNTIKCIINFLSIDNTEQNVEKIITSLIRKINNNVDQIAKKLFDSDPLKNKVKLNVHGKKVVDNFIAGKPDGKTATSNTKYKHAKTSIKKLTEAECSFDVYTDILDELFKLRSNYLAKYGRKEASIAQEELTKYTNIELVFSEELTNIIESNHFKSFIQLYVIYNKSNNKDADFNNEFLIAKEKFLPLLKSAYDNSVDEFIALLEKYDIDEEDEN